MKRLLAAALAALPLLFLPPGVAGPLLKAQAQSGDPNAPTVITPQPPGQPGYLPPGRPGAEPYPASPPQTGQSYPAAPADGQQADGPPQAGDQGTYSDSEILNAGRRFFGKVSAGLAGVIEHAFKRSGRPNGYILGEEAGGAFVAGLRYGEGMLHTKNAGEHKVFWQGPSIGYDFGAEGSKTMILVYNLQRIEDIYNTFGGVDGSAYFIGGVGVTFQTHEHVTLAPIRSGVGLRLGANVGYLKYTKRPTWNPF